MKHRKAKSRRNRFYAWNGGNSKSKYFIFTRGMRSRLANAKEALREIF